MLKGLEFSLGNDAGGIKNGSGVTDKNGELVLKDFEITSNTKLTIKFIENGSNYQVKKIKNEGVLCDLESLDTNNCNQIDLGFNTDKDNIYNLEFVLEKLENQNNPTIPTPVDDSQPVPVINNPIRQEEVGKEDANEDKSDPDQKEGVKSEQGNDLKNEPEQDKDKPEIEAVKDENTEKLEGEKQEIEPAQTDFFIDFEDPVACGEPLTASINSSQEIDFARLEIANFERDFVNTGNPNRLEIVNYFSGFEGIPFGKNQVTLTAYLSNQEVYQDVYTLDFDFSDCYVTRNVLVRTGGFDN